MRIRVYLHTLFGTAATLTACGVLVCTPHTVAGHTPTTTATSTAQCGVIIAPQQLHQPETATIERAISDCSNPFHAHAYTLPFSFSIEDELVTHGKTLTLSGTSTTDYYFDVGAHASPYTFTFYRHEGSDLVYYPIRQVATSQERVIRVHEAAREVFASSTRAKQVATAFLNREPPPANVSPHTYDTFVAAAQASLYTRAPLTPGTYTAVYRERSAPSLVKRPVWLRTLVSVLGATRAHAEEPPRAANEQRIYAITFTLRAATPETPEMPAASNVLFLPGIKASRLYRTAGDTLGERVWEPGSNNDVRALTMTARGSSTESLRTKDVVDEAAIPIFGANIYKDFIAFMDDLVAEGMITAWEPFAYDWRYSVFDVVEHGTPYPDGVRRYPVEAVEQLAASAKSGKVTIIAHSNGGLLAKALLLELARIGKTELVDRVIFVGTPHHGTPQTYGVMLHGANQEQVFGWVVDDVVARTVMRNMPATYHLLPSAIYHDETKDALITFATNTSVTEAFTAEYGTAITDIATTDAFLRGDAQVVSRTGSSAEEIHIPARLNSVLLGEARADHERKLSDWQPPSSVEVYNVVGVGLPTVAGLHYRSVTERDCLLPIIDVLNCTEREYLKPFVRFTLYGDDTVTNTGAQLSGHHTLFFDLPAYNQEIDDQGNHAQLLETSELQKLLESILQTSNFDTSTNFLYKDQPSLNMSYDIESIDSPVDIYSTDKEGRVTGLVNGELKKEIPNSNYFEIGGTKYLVVPSSSVRTTTLIGQDHGSFSYTINVLDTDGQEVLLKVKNATSTPTMVAEIEKTDLQFTSFKIDRDKDGEYEEIKRLQTNNSEENVVQKIRRDKAEDKVIEKVDQHEDAISGGGLYKPSPTKKHMPNGKVLGVDKSNFSGVKSLELRRQYISLLRQLVQVLEQYRLFLYG